MLFMVAREDTAATLIGSIIVAVAYDHRSGFSPPRLGNCPGHPVATSLFFDYILFVSQLLPRVLRIGALGALIGVAAGLVVIYPDTLPPSPESIVESLSGSGAASLVGLSVNAAVQLLLSPGDPLTLLRRALDTRLLAVEQALRRLAGNSAWRRPRPL